MDASLIDLLWTDYNVYRGKTAHVDELRRENSYAGKALKGTPERKAVLASMVGWCRQNHVEPRLWLYYLFRIRGWRYAPKLVTADLQSEKALKRYKPLPRLGFFTQHTRQYALTQDDGWDPNRDLTPSVEALKSRYAQTGQHLRCMQEQLVQTLGYHPKSEVCKACPLAEQCAIQFAGAFPFSILSVRTGALTAAQAEHIARRGGQW